VPQSLATLYVHAVYSTKHRQPLLLDAWREELFTVLGGIANTIGCQSLLVGGVADHVHHLFKLGRTISLADAVGRMKTNSSLWVNQTRGLPVRFQWQGGCAAFGVGRTEVETVREYIRRQPEHHRGEAFQDEVRRWLTDFEMAWDERYCWE
jgi:putative transposase